MVSGSKVALQAAARDGLGGMGRRRGRGRSARFGRHVGGRSHASSSSEAGVQSMSRTGLWCPRPGQPSRAAQGNAGQAAHVLLKIVSSYTKRTRVPRCGRCDRPATAGPAGPSSSCVCATPREKVWLYCLLPRHTVTSSSRDSAFTTASIQHRPTGRRTQLSRTGQSSPGLPCTRQQAGLPLQQGSNMRAGAGGGRQAQQRPRVPVQPAQPARGRRSPDTPTPCRPPDTL